MTNFWFFDFMLYRSTSYTKIDPAHLRLWQLLKVCIKLYCPYLPLFALHFLDLQLKLFAQYYTYYKYISNPPPAFPTPFPQNRSMRIGKKQLLQCGGQLRLVLVHPKCACNWDIITVQNWNLNAKQQWYFYTTISAVQWALYVTCIEIIANYHKIKSLLT